MLIDANESVNYQLFYIKDNDDVKGYLIKMTLQDDQRHEIQAFSQYVAECFDLDIFAVYNTFQEKTCSMAEQLGLLYHRPH